MVARASHGAQAEWEKFAAALAAAPASAIVGGQDATAGQYPAVAQINFGKGFLCTGKLISPDTVLTAGHCGSLTGAAVASPAAWPAPLIDVRIGNLQYGTGGEVVAVAKAIVELDYLLTDGYDITLLKLSRNATKAPVKVSGSGETALWSPGTLETIAGWGATEEGGSSPDVLQHAQVPIVDHATCNDAYDGGIDEDTMLCAGYAQGGIDTCQGDSGGPLFGHTSGGVLRVVGTTSFGTGCARPGIPGVYGRVGDTLLREWIRSQDADGVA